MAERTSDRHAWLDLLDVDGPFLSRPALDESFDRAWPPKLPRDIRDLIAPEQHTAAEDWSTLEADIERLLTEVLGYEPGRTIDMNPKLTVPHGVHPGAGVTVHAIAHVVTTPAQPRLVVLSAQDVADRPRDFDPDHRRNDHNWKATPAQRAAKAARHVGADLALVTDGLRHMIVWVGSGVTGSAWIDPARHRLDRRLADAFVALLHAKRITSKLDTNLADVLRLSQDKQAELTDDLGIQVRAAAEALVNAISRAHRDTEGALLAGVDPHDVYRGVVTVLMRTVFLLNAEERGLIGDADGMWAEHYGVSTLLDQLDDDHYRHAGVMRRRHGAWLRLLAAARAVHGGVDHPDMPTYGYGGGLFDPTRHPFLEGVTPDGEPAELSGVVDDYTVHHVLDLLQRLDGQRLSYRSFSVEQIGHVYEHLLDHDAVTVPDDTVVLGLAGKKGDEPEVPLADLRANHSTDKALAEWLGANHDPASGKTKADKWLKRLHRPPTEAVAGTWQQAGRHDAEVIADIEPYLGLLDVDARGVAKVFLAGDIYVTETSSRRDSGTSYTSPEFAAEIAKHALRHLAYEIELETDDDPSTGLRHPDEILKLKVCDPAVGSGAIIVAAVRYLADRLVDARVEHGQLDASALATAASDTADTDPYIQAARDVVAHCIYAVDRDPMAVEMTKLSLWLITMAKDRPFSFVDHAIRHGDSLLGVTHVEQLRRMHLADEAAEDFSRTDPLLYGGYLEKIDRLITEALDLRAQVRAGDVLGPDDASRRAAISAKADRVLDELRVVADAITAICYRHASKPLKTTSEALKNELVLPAFDGDTDTLRKIGASRPDDCAIEFDFFHWALEFPEVMRDGGFDVMVGNPPFQGGKKIGGTAGKSYREYLIRFPASGVEGSADLVAYFIRRVWTLASGAGLIATNSVSQGDTKRVGLLAMNAREYLYQADSSIDWPGRDSVVVSRIWFHQSPPPRRVLDGHAVTAIEADLYPAGHLSGEPFRIPGHSRVATVGIYTLGDGFFIEDVERQSLPAEEAELAVRFANGADLNSSPMDPGSRYVINPQGFKRERLASEYPSIYSILESRVKPDRDKVRRRQYRDRWWEFAERRPSLQERLDRLDYAIYMTKLSSAVMPLRVSARTLPSQSLVVFPWDDFSLLGVISSAIHRVWVDRYNGTFGSSINYAPTNSFDTFALPGPIEVTKSASQDRLIVAGSEISSSFGRLSTSRTRALASHGHHMTKLYSAVHSPEVRDVAVADLRQQHVELDRAVRDAYGWGDLELGHGFHETRYGTFFTVSTEARFELLMRLLELNFQQYAEQTGRPLDEVIKEAQQHV